MCVRVCVRVCVCVCACLCAWANAPPNPSAPPPPPPTMFQMITVKLNFGFRHALQQIIDPQSRDIRRCSPSFEGVCVCVCVYVCVCLHGRTLLQITRLVLLLPCHRCFKCFKFKFKFDSGWHSNHLIDVQSRYIRRSIPSFEGVCVCVCVCVCLCLCVYG